MKPQQKILVLSRTSEPDSFVQYCTSLGCGYVGETNAVQDPACPRCANRSLRVWKSKV